MKVVHGGRLQFPQVVKTTMRPDVVVWSEEAKSFSSIKSHRKNSVIKPVKGRLFLAITGE